MLSWGSYIMAEVKEQQIRHLVRIANTDLDGQKKVLYAMRKIKGVSYMYANMACTLANIDPELKVGTLSDDQVSKLNDVITSPGKHEVPAWLLNRRKDYESGEDKHLLTGTLQFVKENDIKRLKKIKAYRGMRHAAGLPSRGQRTKSNFRKSKSRGKGGLGVARKAGAKKGR